KSIADKKGIFLLPERRQRIEPLQFGVDEAGMTHDDAAVGQVIEKTREQRLEIRSLVEFVSSREGRIGVQPQRGGPAPEPAAPKVEQQSLGVGKSLRMRWRPCALEQPRIGGGARTDVEHGVADLREQMHVVMAVDEIGGAAERVEKSLHLRGNLRDERRRVEPVGEGEARR